MKRQILALAGTVILSAVTFAAPQQNTAPQGTAAQGPRPKSQKEQEALQKVQSAAQSNDPKAVLAAVSDVLENFTDTAYKPMLLDLAVQSAQQTGDLAETVVWGDRALQANPNDIEARVIVAETMAANTHPTDLDKDKSIKKINDYANKALDLLKTATPDSTGVPAAQWTQLKPHMEGEAHDALGQAAAVEKNYPDAIKELQTAADVDPSDALPLARLTKVYNDSKQYDQAIASADKVLALKNCPTTDNSPCVSPQIKSYVTAQKNFATKLKPAAGASSSSPSGGTTTPGSSAPTPAPSGNATTPTPTPPANSTPTNK